MGFLREFQSPEHRHALHSDSAGGASRRIDRVPTILANFVWIQSNRKRPANSILFVCTAFAFEFSAFGDGPAVLRV